MVKYYIIQKTKFKLMSVHLALTNLLQATTPNERIGVKARLK